MASNAKPQDISDSIPKKTGGVEAEQTSQPGKESVMTVKPQYIRPEYKGADKLKGKVALITGGDSGIGRAVAIHFAREGAAGILFVHLAEEAEDAAETVRLVEAEGSKCLCLAADVSDPKACEGAVDRVVKEFGKLDILVNNAAQQHEQQSIADISPEQVHLTFSVNIFSMFYMVRAALPHLKPGSAIVNTTSVTAYKGKANLVDYSSTKGAIVSFTRSMSAQLVEKGIRVNAVAPGPIWTPLIPSTFGEDAAKDFGKAVPLKRAGQPSEVAPCYVFLASEIDSSYFTGQVLHPNGGTVLNV